MSPLFAEIVPRVAWASRKLASDQPRVAWASRKLASDQTFQSRLKGVDDNGSGISKSGSLVK